MAEERGQALRCSVSRGGRVRACGGLDGKDVVFLALGGGGGGGRDRGYSRRTVGAEAWIFFLLLPPPPSPSPPPPSSSSFFFFFFLGGGEGVTLNKCGQVSLSYLVRTPLCLLGALSGVGLLIWFSAHSVLSLVVIVCRVNLLSSFPPAPTAPADQSKCCKPLRKIACSCHGKYYKNFS